MLYNWLGSDIFPLVITYSLAFIVLLIGSITDLKTREVPDFVNYALIFCGVALNLLFSIAYSNPVYIINSIIGLAIFFAIAYIMFYTGQWGGGDSKMLMGLGATIGISPTLQSNHFLAAFFINIILMGAFYGLVWSVWLAIKNRKQFGKEFKKIISEKRAEKIKKLLLVFLIAGLVLVFYAKEAYTRALILSIVFLMIVSFYIFAFVRSVEKSCMRKNINVKKITEGDWIVSDVWAKKNKKEALISYLIKNSGSKKSGKKSKEAALKKMMKEFYVYSKNPLAKFIKLVYYELIFKNKKEFYNYPNLFNKIISQDSKQKCMPYLKKLSQFGTADYFTFIKENYNFDYGKEYICGPKDLGISKEQIARVLQLKKQNKISKILIKEGIPFVPSFLLAFVFTFIFGNPVRLFVGF